MNASKLLLSVIGLGIFGFQPSASAEAGKVVLLLCSTSSPRLEGFELVRISPRKRRGSGSYTVRSTNYRAGGMQISGAYDAESGRLNARLAQVDEDGDETRFLASVDAVVTSGQHLRFIFAAPGIGAEKTVEQVELVCNVVHSAP